jgi:Ca2+-transporting ATPase
VAAAAASALTVAVAVPGARRLLHFGVPASGDLALAVASVVGAVLLGAAVSLHLRQPGSA